MRIRLLEIIAAVSVLIFAGVAGVGCQTNSPVSVERASYRTISASDQAVTTALQVWAERYARREAENEATRTSDPGGYLARRNALVQELGRASDLHARYSAAVKLVVEQWIAMNAAGAATTLTPVTTTEIDGIRADIEALR